LREGRSQSEKYQSPPLVENDRSEYHSLPARWADEEDYEIYFPIPAKIESGQSEWSSVLVVFGNDKKAVAAGYPDTDMDFKTLKFPGKELVLESRTASTD